MTQDDVLRAAMTVGMTFELPPTKLLQFAALIAAHEREACAKVCDEYDDGRHANTADLCAAAIRSRT